MCRFLISTYLINGFSDREPILNKTLSIALCVSLLGACTTVNVKKVDASRNPLKLVCIEENPKVAVEDLTFVLETGFQRHGIKTLIYQSKLPERCEYTLWYTAFRKWDVVSYLSLAELKLRRGDEVIASATYKHSGGFGLNKWASTESKLNPVIDELLSNFHKNE